MRPSARNPDQLRDIRMTRHYTKHAEGAVLVEFGDTKVICTASVENKVPPFLKGKGQGWITAEYGMLPAPPATAWAAKPAAANRAAAPSKSSASSAAPCAPPSTSAPWANTASSSTATSSRPTAAPAPPPSPAAASPLVDALNSLVAEGRLKQSPLKQMIGAISVGIHNGTPVLDLDYAEDSTAETDMNVIMTDKGGFIELQGTAEGEPFEQSELDSMLELARKGINELFEAQKQALAD